MKNRLTYLRRVGSSPAHKSIGLYRCACGREVEILEASVRSGRQLSCGCLMREKCIARSTKHGMRWSPEYRTWCNVKSRATNPNMPDAKNYVERGVTISKRWLKFENFLADMGKKPTPRHSIERKDNDGPYSKKNCRWATQREQAQNTRRNVFLEHGGERLILAEWARRLGGDHSHIQGRIRLGWSVSDAVTTPIRRLPPR